MIDEMCNLYSTSIARDYRAPLLHLSFAIVLIPDAINDISSR